MSTYSNLKIEEITLGDSGWGTTTTNNLLAIQQALQTATLATGDFTSNVATLPWTNTNATTNTPRAMVLNITATLTGAGTVNLPAITGGKAYLVVNGSSGGFAVTVKVTGLTGVSVPNGKSMWLWNNGTDVVDATNYISSLSLGAALPLTSGGTGATTQQAAINALTGSQTSGRYLRSDGTNASLSTIQAADVPTLNQNTTGTAAGLSTTLAVASGGTGQTTASAAINALLPTQTGQSGKYLTTNGTSSSWATVSSGGTPGGSSTQIQFNNAGAFGGNSNFTINLSTGAVTFGLNTSINGVTFGAGSYSSNNIAAGANALNKVGNAGSYNIAIGPNAMYNGATSGAGYNVAVGTYAGSSLTSGTYNVLLGYNAGGSNTSGSNNINIGQAAGLNFNRTTGDEASGNIFIGDYAGFGTFGGTSTGYYNVAIGISSGMTLNTGFANILIGTGYNGSGAGALITSGSKNVVLGNYDGANPGGSSVAPDITTSSGYIIFADGDGVVRGYSDDTSSWRFNTVVNTKIVQRVVAIADGTSVTINADTTDIATQANTQAVGTLTIAAPTGSPVNGQKLIFRLRSTNVQTFSWNAIFAGSTDLALPTASSGSSKYDYLGFIFNSTAGKWQLLAKNFGF